MLTVLKKQENLGSGLPKCRGSTTELIPHLQELFDETWQLLSVTRVKHRKKNCLTKQNTESFSNQNQHLKLYSEANQVVSDEESTDVTHFVCPIPLSRWAIKSLCLLQGGIKISAQSQHKLEVTAQQRLQINGFGVTIDKGRTA